jgi:hypothetical protein
MHFLYTNLYTNFDLKRSYLATFHYLLSFTIPTEARHTLPLLSLAKVAKY